MTTTFIIVYNRIKAVVIMKKATKKILIVFLTAILLVINSNFAFAAEIVFPQIELSSPELYDSTSSTLDLSVYFNLEEFNDYLVEQLKTVPKKDSLYVTIDISQFNIPYNDSVKNALNELIWYNSPELFRIDSLGYSYSGNRFTKLFFTPHYSHQEYSAMHQEMSKKANKLLYDVEDNPNLTDLEKALILHDRLALYTSYDRENLNNGTLPASARNAYGILVLQTGVCMGYAMAYDYLLERVGIKSLYCSSTILNHAWNIIYINDKPYHVDVTWDDPVWDMHGRVSHKNFLLSTEALKATGHTATDFFSFPNDTTYDNYYWNTSNTSFQLIDNEFYFFNSQTRDLCKVIDTETGEIEILKQIKDTWSTSGGFYSSSYTKLLCDSFYLYYNTKDTIYQYDPKTGKEEIFLTPDVKAFGDYHWIYGIYYLDCKIYCEIYSSPNYTVDVRKSYTVVCDAHTPSRWVTIKNATFEEEGEKERSCLVCSKPLCKEPIPKLPIAPLEETDVIIDDDIIFTSTDLCNTVDSLVKFSENVTYEVTPSLSTDDADFLGTGSIVSIYEDGEKVSEYKIIVSGDLNGDSVCDVFDIYLTELCSTNYKTPSADECYAANGIPTDKITIDSLLYVVNTALY